VGFDAIGMSLLTDVFVGRLLAMLEIIILVVLRRAMPVRSDRHARLPAAHLFCVQPDRIPR
jgi:hypothetical protein